MLFHTYVFWAFFAVVIALYWRVSHRWQNRLLLAASWYFYGCWDWRFLFLLIGTTVLDYFVALAIEAAPTRRGRKAWVLVSVVVNLSLLGFFKYFGFFAHEMQALLQSLGFQASLPALRVILPVGISFYTFQELSYTIDVYRGEIRPVRNLLDFALYVAFFPQLVAGPIERSGNLIPQVLEPRTLRPGDFSQGLYLVITGLFRKVVIADSMASYANAIFARPANELSGLECLLGVYAFALQIYGDFSGYSDIARGIAKWMGFDLMVNFRMPYLAISPSDFWRRWHISLSTWLRDYLYIPLGGNRGSSFKTYCNLMITMLLGGLWHGANWTFIAWGAFHGLLLCIWRPFQARRPQPPPDEAPTFKLANLLRIGLMFHLVCFGWLLFRAQSLTQAGQFLARIATDFRFTHIAAYGLSLMLFFAGPFLLYEWWVEKKDDLTAIVRGHWLKRGLLYAYLLLMVHIYPPDIAHEFIYFQF
jgi:alginate O-acetyltransferase complex protein AlgI